jgi:hypothetical protein
MLGLDGVSLIQLVEPRRLRLPLTPSEKRMEREPDG